MSDTKNLVARLRRKADYAKRVGMPSVVLLLNEAADALEQSASIPEGYERDEGFEGGQANGVGEIEPSWAREWYSDDRESHRRHIIHYTGPWEEKP